ncbi:putative transmembrane protein [Apostichopus japonicus]|uniref:Putative transmembrane protein n=1 Tax=Stichopus japonicus TaxID=307972 RepID=A0A2G8KT96_STIJA|nr:putative transmembrane protein [Apostichopus japonicus]
MGSSKAISGVAPPPSFVVTVYEKQYSPSLTVGLIYIFNLIVGTGALTMPLAFSQAGWLTSIVIICLLAFAGFVNATFVIEAMAAANAIIKHKRKVRKKEVRSSAGIRQQFEFEHC